MVTQNKIVFEIGQIVYLKTDVDQLPYLVTGILLKETHVLYELSHASDSPIMAEEMEISINKDFTVL